MIFHLYFALIMGGYFACSTLLGSYMILYAGAQEIDLGFLFMIQPFIIFLRPFICAQADRYQSHKQMLAFFAVLSSVSYIPFAAMPFVIKYETPDELHHNQRFRFWLMVVCHIFGSIGFCGVRSLGDATAINFAKRFGTDFARYRKYGSISYGICGYLIGRINQRWLLPDFVPGFLMYCSCMLALSILVYAWPDEYFIMKANERGARALTKEELKEENSKLPTAGETVRHVLGKLVCMHNSAPKKQLPMMADLGANPMKQQQQQQQEVDLIGEQKRKNLSITQQLSIFKLLCRRDFRLALYLLVIFYNGLVAYSGPNFVFTYLNETCKRKGTCNGAELAGLVMISYCTVETIGYMIIDKLRGHLNRVLMIELTFISVIVHYFFYGFLLDSLSPYWFLVESLHGIEYSIGLSTSVELGYYFAREVELLLPELRSKKIITEEDDEERVRVSLMATLSGCYTFMYDGIGCIVGCLVFGLTTGLYSFRTTWILIGTLSVIGFLTLFFTWLIGKCCKIRPQILTIRDQVNNNKQTAPTSSC